MPARFPEIMPEKILPKHYAHQYVHSRIIDATFETRVVAYQLLRLNKLKLLTKYS